MYSKREGVILSKPTSSIAKIANTVDIQNKDEIKQQQGVMSPNLNFDINLDSSDTDSDDVDISHETKPINIPANSRHMLSLKRPVSSPTFSRSKRNSADNKELNSGDSPDNNKGAAFLGRVVSAPPTISSSSSNKASSSSGAVPPNSKHVVTVKEKGPDNGSHNSGYVLKLNYSLNTFFFENQQRKSNRPHVWYIDKRFSLFCVYVPRCYL